MIRRMVSLSLLIILLILTGCKPGASQPLSISTPTATITAQPPTFTLTPAPSMTWTIIPSPTSTSTQTPTPTITLTPSPTPSPTPTPYGLFVHDQLGFSFTRPDSWKVLENQPGFISLEDRYTKLVFLAYSFYGSEKTTIEDIADDAAHMFFNTEVYSKHVGEVTLASGQTAPTVKMVLNTPWGYIASQVVYVRYAQRGYVFMIYSNPNPQEVKPEKLEKFFSTINLFIPELQGLDQKDTLVQLGNEPDASEIDPASTTSGTNSYANLLFSGLVRLSSQLEIVPDLAESWTISPDRKTYTFKLRPDLKFASGRQITAQDVMSSWERAADPALKSTTARTYLGDIQGVIDKLDGKAEHIEGIEVIDDNTIQVTLTTEQPYFLAKLTHPVSYVVEADQVRDPKFNWLKSPNASGPYRLRQYRSGESISFETNPNYHNPAGIPHLVYLFYGDFASLILYEDKLLDIAQLAPSDAVQVQRTDHPQHQQLQILPSLCTEMLLLNNTQPPMNDPKIRQAFVSAIDQASIIDHLTEGTDLPAGSILPPAMPGYSAELASNRFDPEAAKNSLAASSFPAEQPSITLNAPGYADSNSSDVSSLVDMWHKYLGIDVKVEYLDPTQYTQAARDQHAQMVLYNWCADYPDPGNFLETLFHSRSNFNVTGYNNPEVDRLLEQAGSETNTDTRIQLYQQVEKILLEDAAVIPLKHHVYHTLASPRVKGFNLSPIETMFLPEILLAP